jgi:N-acetylmuramoyl-L-alanine amidase CwlA
VKGIVYHYTASPGAPAKNIDSFFDRLAQQNPNDNVDDHYASAHFSVDDTSIYATIPYKSGVAEMAYHVGSKTYTAEALKKLGSYPNNCTIGIEMCIDKNGNITEKTFQNAADLGAFLCKMHGLTEADLWTHKGVVGWKDCPLPWVKKPSEFERMKAEVAKRLKPAPAPAPKPVVKPAPVKAKVNLPSVVLKRGDKGANVLALQKALVTVGFAPNKDAKDKGCDSSFGPATESALKKFQAKYSLVADGIYGPKAETKLEALINK